MSFRRASGYVEQFDVQTPELTVFETILYSARLRLDKDQVKTDIEKIYFVHALMKTLELNAFTDALVGTSECGGLSFEQKKRLSIAVELAASPSIFFLDEVRSLRLALPESCHMRNSLTDIFPIWFSFQSQPADSTQGVLFW